VPIFLKFGSSHLLEHSGSVQACTGIALPLSLAHYENKTHTQHKLVEVFSHNFCYF